MNIIKNHKFLFFIFGIYAVLWLLIAIAPNNRFDWMLENILTVVSLALLGFTYKKFKFSNVSYSLFFIFLILHTIGSGCSYMIPIYDNFVSVRGLKFDRLVHFSYGLLLSYPVMEFLTLKVKIRRNWTQALSVIVILASSAFYELIEMWIAKIVSPSLGKLFLGDTGGWDAQHDMEAALLGAVITMIVVIIIDIIKTKKEE